MSNPDLRRYEKELRASVKGFRLRRRLHRSFRQAVMPYLEDTAAPSYEELTAAFGPPDLMAQDLLRTMANPPQPLRRGQKVGIVLVACSLVATIGFGVFSWWNTPETKFFISNDTPATEEILQKGYAFALDSPFSQNDVSWNQPRESQSYWLVLYNTNSLDTDVEIRYSKHLSSHSFTIPPKETLSFLVEDARPGEHILSFITSDGSFLGSVQIFLSKPTQ